MSREMVLWIPAIYLAILHMVFHVEGRYTLPARATLLLYPAEGLILVLVCVRRLVTLVRIRAKRTAAQ